MLVKRHNRKKQLSGVSQLKSQEQKNCEDTKGIKYELNASKFINIDEIIINKDYRSEDHVLHKKFHQTRDAHQSIMSLKE